MTPCHNVFTKILSDKNKRITKKFDFQSSNRTLRLFVRKIMFASFEEEHFFL